MTGQRARAPTKTASVVVVGHPRVMACSHEQEDRRGAGPQGPRGPREAVQQERPQGRPRAGRLAGADDGPRRRGDLRLLPRAGGRRRRGGPQRPERGDRGRPRWVADRARERPADDHTRGRRVALAPLGRPGLEDHALLKIPHHGSRTSHHPPLFTRHKRTRAWAATPFNSHDLPDLVEMSGLGWVLSRGEPVHLTAPPVSKRVQIPVVHPGVVSLATVKTRIAARRRATRRWTPGPWRRPQGRSAVVTACGASRWTRAGASRDAGDAGAGRRRSSWWRDVADRRARASTIRR